MKPFDDFKTIIKSDYREISHQASTKANSFIEQNDCLERKSEVYAELFSMELLKRYHEWNNS